MGEIISLEIKFNTIFKKQKKTKLSLKNIVVCQVKVCLKEIRFSF